MTPLDIIIAVAIGLLTLFALVAGGFLLVMHVRYRSTDAYREHQQLRSGLSEIRLGIDRLQRLIAESDRRLAQAVQEFEQAKRTEAVRALPVEDLRKYGANNVRWSGLESAGVRNLEDLWSVLPYLERYDGIGATSAGRIREAANAAMKDIYSREIPLPGPDLGTPTDMQLARVVETRAALRQNVEPLLQRLAELESDIEGRTRDLRVGFSDFAWKRDEFEEAAKLTSEIQGVLTRRLEDLEPAETVTVPRLSEDEIRQGFGENYADACALIESHSASDTRRASARGNLDEERALGVERFPLETEGLDVNLRKYQAFGSSFMLTRKRTIVGDEMGLGKTIEAIAAMNHLARRGETHFLVVSPAGLIFNWKNEILNRSELKPILLYGGNRDVAVRQWAAQGGVGITSYTTLRTIRGQIVSSGVKIAMFVGDEAHYVKNPDAQRTQATREVVGRAEHVCLMTGTPMENRPEEFAELVAMVSPKTARRVQSSDGVVHAGAFKKRVADVYLRRNQRDVLTELPQQIEHEDWVQLKRADIAAYVSAVRDKHWHNMRKTAVLGDRKTISAKFERLGELFDTYREEGRKIVVFSHYLDVLADLGRRWPEILGPLSGSVTPARRQELIEKFRAVDGFAIMSSQIQAGGVGINLQFASVVVLMEPQLKPSTEEQAIARLRRMGQVRSVMVHRLLAERTLEEDILEILGRKRRQFDAYARDSLAKAMSAKATESDAVTAIIERQTLRLAAEGLIPEDAVRELGVERPAADAPEGTVTRPLQAVEIEDAEIVDEAPSSTPRDSAPASPEPRVTQRLDAVHEPNPQVAAAATEKLDVSSLPLSEARPEPQVPRWAKELVREMESDLTAARIDDEKVLAVFAALEANGHRTNVTVIAEALDTTPARAVRLLTALLGVINGPGEVMTLDRGDGHVRLDAEAVCRRLDVDFEPMHRGHA